MATGNFTRTAEHRAKLSINAQKRNGTYGLTPTERFYKWVLKTESCWLWTGSKNKSGYGLIHVKGQNGRNSSAGAHRVSWVLHCGEIPAGMHVCHHCDNPTCVRPDHLFLGTRTDNMRDAKAKGRCVLVKSGQQGERNLHAKLTADIVLRLRAEAREWSGFKQDLHRAKAAQYGVSETCIRTAIKGKTRWTHL